MSQLIKALSFFRFLCKTMVSNVVSLPNGEKFYRKYKNVTNLIMSDYHIDFCICRRKHRRHKHHLHIDVYIYMYTKTTKACIQSK